MEGGEKDKLCGIAVLLLLFGSIDERNIKGNGNRKGFSVVSFTVIGI